MRSTPINRGAFSGVASLSAALVGLCLLSSPSRAQVGFGAGTTGGAGGTTVTVSNATAFAQYAGENVTGKYIVRVNGTITLGAMTRVGADKSILGVGSTARFTGYGLRVRTKNNVIIRNITFSGSSDDGIEITESADRVWVDHCSFSSNNDACLDIKHGSNNVTVSHNLFSNHNKTTLIGHSDSNAAKDSGKLKSTYYMNYFNGTTQRHPRVRFAQVHVYNNYYRNIGSYGIATTCQAQVRVENNYFQGVPRPISYSEGSSPAGFAQGTGNVLSSSGAITWSGSVFTPPYGYSMQAASNLPSSVPAGAGVGKVTF